MRRFIDCIRHAYYARVMDLAMQKIKRHTSDHKTRYWVEVLCKYAVKTIEI